MLSPRNSLEFNYSRRVRPEVEWRQGQSQLRRSVTGLNSRLNEQRREIQSVKSGLTPTGHSTSFLNYGGYYGFGR